MKKNGLAALAVFSLISFAIPVGARSDDSTTSSFLAACKTDPDNCKVQVGFGVVTGGHGCPPESMELPTAAQAQEVLSWMEAHPQVHPEDWTDAMDAAFEALYPCSK